MEADKVPEKLKLVYFNPVDWPKVPDYVEDSVIAAVTNASVKFGDNQY